MKLYFSAIRQRLEACCVIEYHAMVESDSEWGSNWTSEALAEQIDSVLSMPKSPRQIALLDELTCKLLYPLTGIDVKRETLEHLEVVLHAPGERQPPKMKSELVKSIEERFAMEFGSQMMGRVSFGNVISKRLRNLEPKSSFDMEL